MARKIVELSNIFPYHLCARSNNKDWFDLPMNQVFEIYVDVLERTINLYKIKCHSFVLMSNHFHMLASTPDENLSSAMRYFMSESSRAIARASRRINHVYGSRYHWTIIRSSEHYAHAFKYIYRNPVEAKISFKVEEYQWSSFYNFNSKLKSLINNNENGYDEYLPNDLNEMIDWLNHNDDPEYINNIKKALRKHEFSFSQNNQTGKCPNYLDKLNPLNFRNNYD